MILHPVIENKKQLDAETVALDLHIPSDLYYFEGHFPDTPILPGISQLHWAVSIGKDIFNMHEYQFERLEVLKFQAVIVPEQKVVLTLKRVLDKPQQVSFSFESKAGKHASGRIILREKNEI